MIEHSTENARLKHKIVCLNTEIALQFYYHVSPIDISNQHKEKQNTTTHNNERSYGRL